MVVFTLISVVTSINGGKGECVGDGAAGTEAAVTVVGSSETSGISFGAIADAAATRTVDGTGEGVNTGEIAGGVLTALSFGKAGVIGLLVVGASNNSNEDGTTFDCWKQVLHDKSKEPSRGMLLKEICSHPNVMKVTTTEGNHPDLPRIVIENIWNEVFEIEYLWVHATGNIICHALPI